MRELKVSATITFFLAPGLALFGWIMGLFLAPELFGILLGVGALVLLISAGLYAASLVAQRSIDNHSG